VARAAPDTTLPLLQAAVEAKKQALSAAVLGGADPTVPLEELWWVAGPYTPPLLTSTSAVFVTETTHHARDVFYKKRSLTLKVDECKPLVGGAADPARAGGSVRRGDTAAAGRAGGVHGARRAGRPPQPRGRSLHGVPIAGVPVPGAAGARGAVAAPHGDAGVGHRALGRAVQVHPRLTQVHHAWFQRLKLKSDSNFAFNFSLRPSGWADTYLMSEDTGGSLHAALFAGQALGEGGAGGGGQGLTLVRFSAQRKRCLW